RRGGGRLQSKDDVHSRAAAGDEPRAAGGAPVADRPAARGGQTRGAPDPARIRQSAGAPVGGPGLLRFFVTGVHEVPEDRTGAGCAGQGPVRDRLVGAARRDAGSDRVPVPVAQHPRLQAVAAPMRTVTRYLAREIYRATALAFLAFLVLFAFFDLLSELDDL